jgi:competence protein ComGC
MVVSGMMVVVVAALLFLLAISLPNIAKFEGRIEAASETRLS